MARPSGFYGNTTTTISNFYFHEFQNFLFPFVGIMNGQGTSDSPDLLPDNAEYVID